MRSSIGKKAAFLVDNSLHAADVSSSTMAV
jgi:hypothetical protein